MTENENFTIQVKRKVNKQISAQIRCGCGKLYTLQRKKTGTTKLWLISNWSKHMNSGTCSKVSAGKSKGQQGSLTEYLVPKDGSIPRKYPSAATSGCSDHFQIQYPLGFHPGFFSNQYPPPSFNHQSLTPILPDTSRVGLISMSNTTPSSGNVDTNPFVDRQRNTTDQEKTTIFESDTE